MANKIKIKRSYTPGSSPLTTDLETHECAINWNDGKLFVKQPDGTLRTITLGGGSSSEDARWEYFKPAAPTGVTATATNAQAVVSWTAPAIVVPPVTDYTVQVSTNGGTTWTTATDAVSAATGATITGLTNGTAHVFRVAGINGIGTGAYSTASAAVTPTSGDPLFASVALLLPMDGTGSAFVDASATQKTITANGGATQSTAHSKWGGKSLALDGDGDFLTAGSIPLGTSDFVIEGWFYLPSLPSGGTFTTLFAHRPDASTTGGALLVMNGSSLLYFIAGTSGWQVTGTSTGLSVSANTWMHIAFVRSGNECRAYLNGTGGNVVSVSGSIATSGSFSIMAGAADGSQAVAGYCDDFRVTVGSSRGYTGATIPVPVAAFPTRGIYEDPFFESVSLLLPMDGTGSAFADSSLTPKTITATNATQSATQSKWGGKSAFFTGTSRLSASTSSAFSFGTGDFCVEMWVYPSGASAYQTLFSTRSSDTNEDADNVFLGFNTGTLTPIVFTSSLVLSGSASLSAGAWSHIAFVRASGVISIYLNGTRIGNASFSTSITGTNASIGLTQNNEHQFAGYIDDVRITKGNARGYAGASITVPTAAFPTS
jgi:hypothetical protein